MNSEINQNIDHAEREKFDSVASGWWDPEGPFRPLHDLNPARLKFIADRADIAEGHVLDVGCGGGILAESLARKGGRVTGIDVASKVLAIARLHLH
ncbi:methyltransferase domain-containing protein, partial [Pseudomonadota bacterium]